MKNLFLAILITGLYSHSVFAANVWNLKDISVKADFEKLSTYVTELRANRQRSVIEFSADSFVDSLRIFIQGSEDSFRRAYRNGELYFLIGNLDNEWTKEEWTRFYEVAKRTVRNGFKTVLNPLAFESDLREATQNPKTSVIIWSSHGTENGYIMDSNGKEVPTDAFYTDVQPRRTQVVMSACYGEVVVKTYALPSQFHMTHWTGDTTSDELFGYLGSNAWSKDLVRYLGISLD